MRLEILYENADMLAVAKPAGIVAHPDLTHTTDTLIEEIVRERPEIRGVGEEEARPGVVHRLDKDTSGVLVIAKNTASYMHLKNLFKTGKVKKTYLALVVGSPKDDAGVIDAPIARSTKNFQKRVVGGKQGREREARTEYRVRERLGGYSLLEVSPKTGRTHQIRSHLAHIGHPVACDRLYGGKRFLCPMGLGRQFLHALSIELDALSGARLKIEAPLPDDLSRTLKQLQSEK